MTQILPGLLLGGLSDALYLLGKRSPLKVTHLLTLRISPIDWADVHTPHGALVAKLVPVNDLPSTDLLTHFPSCVSFIAEGLEQGGTIVVHWYVIVDTLVCQW